MYDFRSRDNIRYGPGHRALYLGKASSLNHALEELKHKQGQELIDFCTSHIVQKVVKN